MRRARAAPAADAAFENEIGDLFTKTLGKGQFVYLLTKLGIDVLGFFGE